MQYYVTLTSICNLKCRYCYEKCCNDFGVDLGHLTIDYSVPSSIKYDIADLERFCQEDPDPTIVLYGGEPLLRTDLLEKIIDTVPARNFILQTNGTLLHELSSRCLHRLSTILVSIDGDKEITDYYRGKGVYDQVLQNIKEIRERMFTGEIVARMTVSNKTKIDREVLFLVFNGYFNSIHWQLDALFWHNDYDKEQFTTWLRTEYNPEVRRLVNAWIRHMEDRAEVLRIYPLLGITQSLLLNEPTRLRCGAGWTMFNIQTDGNITPCPVMAGMKDFYLGHIKDIDPGELASRAVSVGDPCTSCDIYSICGGRCLYANVTKLWGEDGFRLVCSTVVNLVDALKDAVPRIQDLMSKGMVQLQDFDYRKYNSCEIIP